MAWTQADLDAVDAALTSGTKSVTFSDGRQITNQDSDKLLAVRNVIKAELIASATGVTPRLRTTRARMCRR